MRTKSTAGLPMAAAALAMLTAVIPGRCEDKARDAMTIVNPFLGDWRGTTRCVDPEGPEKSFRFTVTRDANGGLACTDHSARNRFKPPHVVDDGDRYTLRCPWYRESEEAKGLYVFHIDKSRPGVMYGEESTQNLPERRYAYRDMVRADKPAAVTPESALSSHRPDRRAAASGILRAEGGMARVPAGTFNMGDAFSEGMDNERPVHRVELDAFWMDKHEVTKDLWDRVAAWAASRGYEFNDEVAGKAGNHPVHSVDWHSAVKWCNARSEMEGRTPCYTSDEKVFRLGRSDELVCDWTADGYRLPTEAEWEYAARGGLKGQRFPGGSAIAHAAANYRCYYRNGRRHYEYDAGPTEGHHPACAQGKEPFTSPVDRFAANGYGLHDMAGNVWEWCWDRHSSDYYKRSPARNPRGPDDGSNRTARGGCWHTAADGLRVAYRFSMPPKAANSEVGLRCVRSR